jgi:hypothetical protein
MTERTASGRTRRRSPARAAKSRKRDESPLAHLGPVTWAFAMLMASVALAAAAVFTHKAL